MINLDTDQNSHSKVAAQGHTHTIFDFFNCAAIVLFKSWSMKIIKFVIIVFKTTLDTLANRCKLKNGSFFFEKRFQNVHILTFGNAPQGIFIIFQNRPEGIFWILSLVERISILNVFRAYGVSVSIVRALHSFFVQLSDTLWNL